MKDEPLHGSANSQRSTKIWWLFFLVAVTSGSIVLDHTLPVTITRLSILQERSYQERVGSPHHYHTYPSVAINSNILRLSDGTVLQLSSLGDFISQGDTLELERTLLWKEPLRYRKLNGRWRTWLEVDSNKMDYRPYPYLVFIFAFLLLFSWRSDNVRWSLQAGMALMLLCWLLVIIGTGGMGRLFGMF